MVIVRAVLLCRRPPLSGRGLCGGGCCASSAASLGLLVFGCFKFLDFPVKCKDAGWFLEVKFHGIFSSCHFEHGYCYFGCPKPSILQAMCLHLAPWEPLWPLGGALADHGSSRRDMWGLESSFDLVILGWFWGPFWKFFGLRWIWLYLLFGFVFRLLFAPVFEWNSWRLEFFKKGLRLKGIAKRVFAKLVL